MTEAARIVASAASTQAKLWVPDERDRAIESIAQLLSSGRPISEILDAAKRLAGRGKSAEPNGATEPDKQTLRIVRSAENEAAHQGTAVAELIDVTVGHEGDDSLGAQHRSSKAALGVGLPHGERLLEAAPGRSKWFGLLGVVALWLIPALSLALIVTAGRMSIDPSVAQNAAEAAATVIIGTRQPGLDQPRPAPEKQERVAATLPAKPERAEAASTEPDRAKPQLTPEQISALLARGDALVSAADIASARLFFERAAAAGDAQAAVRLGATYDPAFLAQVKLGIHGDIAAAQYWYQRARDLGAKQGH